MNPRPARQILDDHFLEARCRLLDLAAILDRIDRGADAASLEDDPRMQQLREGLSVLLKDSDRARKVQMVFSLPYNAEWQRP